MKQMKKLLSVLLAVLMVFSLMSTALAAQADESLAGKVVILHSNDVHGAVEGYAKIAALRDEYVKQGAEVILADAGDFCQGTPYVSLSKGAKAVEMMNTAGYDIITLGNHEFDFGYDNLIEVMKDANFKIVCGDVTKEGKAAFDGWAILEKKGVKIGFVGLETPETYTKVNPGLIQGVAFLQKAELYTCAQKLVDDVKAAGADIVVGLFHLGVDDESEGNRSMDVYANVKGLDLILDGHSHTAMTPGVDKSFAEVKKDDKTGEMVDVFHDNPCKDLPIQSTGTKFNNVGVVVIDPAAKKIESCKLVPARDITVADDSAVLLKAKEIEKAVDDEYGAVFAKSEVELNGDKAPNGNRDSETNLGDLITDAMRWSVLKDTELKVPAENVVCITNGGGIRAWLHKGDLTMKDVNTVLPFGNTVAVIYVTGAELLEALEASCYMMPGAIGGFPQVSGMKYTVDIGMPCDQGEQYPESTYYGPTSIQRVTINEVGGKAFDEEANYAVVTNNFCAAGGDTYYAFKAASDQFDTSIPMDEALMNYITEELGGVIGEQYAAPQGRIAAEGTVDERELREQILAISDMIVPRALTPTTAKAVTDALGEALDADGEEELQAALDKLVEAVKGMKFLPNTFDDVKTDDWFAPAVDFAAAMGLMKGTSTNIFEPYTKMTRGMVMTVLYRLAGEPGVKSEKSPFADVTDPKAWFYDAVLWGYENGIAKGKGDNLFKPDEEVTREQMATFLARFSGEDTDQKLTEEEAANLDAYLAKSFTDADQISGWAKLAVGACREAGVMNGDTTGTFRPADSLTRGEAAQILFNLYNAELKSVLPAEETEAAPAGVLRLFDPAA